MAKLGSRLRTRKRKVPAGVVGKVIQVYDPKTFVVAVEEPSLRYRDFIEVRFTKGGQEHILIAQIDLIAGENVKIGTKTTKGGIGGLGFSLGVDFESTEDVERTRVKATARIVALLDSTLSVISDELTVEYMGNYVYRAAKDNLGMVFSQLGDTQIAPLEVGTLIGTTDTVSVVLDPTGLMRHTAVFGQSGSGKSFSFGIVLEELLLKTDARVVVIDPNSDYNQFHIPREYDEVIKNSRRSYSTSDHEDFIESWNNLADSFLKFTRSETGDPLVISMSDLRREDQARLLGLDPIHDREEYSTFREALESLSNPYQMHDLMKTFASSPSVEKVRLLYRIKNRELDELPLWGAPSIIELLRNKEWRFASLDLDGVTPLERSLISAAVLESLYKDMTVNRQVTFFVIDEAHNLCPSNIWDEHQEAPRKIIQEIAAEGRKYGAYLILLTQNPSKLSEQVLTQCDNVILMHMTSGHEVEALGAILEESGARLAQLAFTLSKGQALCLGGVVRNETAIKFDLRRSTPGGSDVGKEWAMRKTGDDS